MELQFLIPETIFLFKNAYVCNGYLCAKTRATETDFASQVELHY